MLKHLPLIYMLILLLLSTLPINGDDTNSILNNNYTLSIRWDYLVHAFVYIPMVPLLKIRLASQKTIKIILLSLTFAISLEAIQLLVPWRTFNVNDMASNTLGVGMGFLLLLLIKRISGRN